MASDAWPEDIPIWIDGGQKWMTGLTRRTTCDDVIYALLYARGLLDTDSPDNYAVFERWRAVERPLQGRTKIVKVWSAWDKEQPNVQLLVQRLDDYFIPTEASKARRRHRRYTRQRLRHADTKCRCCGGRSQHSGGRPRAAEQLGRHLVRQEQQLQELRQRAAETDRQIALHEARQHARRVQQNGADYVQDSYLLRPARQRTAPGDGGAEDRESAEGGSGDSRRECGSDFGSGSSTCSGDSLDGLLLAVGEEDLDEYLDLCADLHDVITRLEQAERTQQALARDIEMAAAERDQREEEEWEEAGTAEALRVQITREVAASVLQQQQEIDVVRELRLWESKVKERSKRVRQLQEQLDIPNKAMNTLQQNQTQTQPVLQNTLNREQEVIKFNIATRSGQGRDAISPTVKSPLQSKADDLENKSLSSEEVTHKNSTAGTSQPSKTVVSLQLEQDLIGSKIAVEKSRFRTLSRDGTALRRRSRSTSRERTNILKPPLPPRNPCRAGDVVYAPNNPRLDTNKAEVFEKTVQSLQQRSSSISHLSRQQYPWPLCPQTFTREQFGSEAKDEHSIHTSVCDIPSGARVALSVSDPLAASPQTGELVLRKNSAHSCPGLPLSRHITSTQDYLHQTTDSSFSPHENVISSLDMQQSNRVFNRQDSPKVQELIGHLAVGLASELKERLSDCPGNYRIKSSLTLSNKEMQSNSNFPNQGSHDNHTERPIPFYKSVQQSSISHLLRHPRDYPAGTDSQTNGCQPVSMTLVGGHDLIVSREIKLSKPDFCFPVEPPALPPRHPASGPSSGLRAAASLASLPGSHVCETSDQHVSNTSSDRSDGVPMLVNPSSGSFYPQGQNDQDPATVPTSTLANDCKSYPETHSKRTDTVQKEYTCGTIGDGKDVHAYRSFFHNPVNGRSDIRRCVTGAYGYKNPDSLRNNQAIPSQSTTNTTMSNGLDPYKSMTHEVASTVPPFFRYNHLTSMGNRGPAVHQRHLTLMTSHRDDSGVGSSDSSTDSGMLLMEAAADHGDVIGSRPSAARRAPLCLDQDSYLDLSLFGLGLSVDFKTGPDAGLTAAPARGRDHPERDEAVVKTARTLTSSSVLDQHSFPSSSSTSSGRAASSSLSSSSSQMASSTSISSSDTNGSQDRVAVGSYEYSCPKPSHYTISYETVVTEDDWLHSTDDNDDVFDSGDCSEEQAKHEKGSPWTPAVTRGEAASERAPLASGRDKNSAPPASLPSPVLRSPPAAVPQSIIKHRPLDAQRTTSTSADEARPAPIISSASDKRRGPHAAQAKTVRFAEEMNSWAWCDAGDDGGESSDDTGLSSLQADDFLVTLV